MRSLCPAVAETRVAGHAVVSPGEMWIGDLQVDTSVDDHGRHVMKVSVDYAYNAGGRPQLVRYDADGRAIGGADG